MHFSEGCPLPASSPLHFPECLPPLPKPLILLGNVDPVFVPHPLDESWGGGGGVCLTACFWLTHRGERRGWERECVHTYDYTCLHVCRRRESPGKVTAAVFSAVCSLGNSVAFTDDQCLLCFSKNYANESASEGFGQDADGIWCPSDSTYWR